MSVPQPTDFELEILQELWARGPLTVRHVHDVLSARRQLVYTSVLKAMQLMHEKGLLLRDDSQRSHVYHAAVEEHAIKKGIVGNLVDQVFGGSAAGLAMHALSTRPASSEEIRKIQDLLVELEAQHQEASPKRPEKGKKPDPKR
jgi:predicted transcriptional regulator